MSKPVATPEFTGTSTALIHVSQVLRRPVLTPSGEAVGRVEDIVVRLRGAHTYPLVTGVVTAVGGHRVFAGSRSINRLGPDWVTLRRSQFDLPRFERRPGEVLLQSDVLGDRLIDVAAGELVRVYDIELEKRAGEWVLARLDSRRPPRLFALLKTPCGQAARDWKAFEPLTGHGQSLALRRVSGRVAALDPGHIADLLAGTDSAEARQSLGLLDDMSDDEVAALLGRMRADDAADTLIDLRPFRRRRVIDLMPGQACLSMLNLLGFNPGSAGETMTVDVVSCGPGATVREALTVVGTAVTVQPAALAQIHVLDHTGRLAGVAPVVTLLQSRPTDMVAALMDSDPIRVSPDADLADVAVLIADNGLRTVPVVDDEDRLLGVVTIDDVLKAVIPDDWRRRAAGPGAVPEPVSLIGQPMSGVDQGDDLR
ncbi:CBS domain-containing protein [Mycobacterium sp.]|uniref:CBS domain-containing protein n=1 Tax=Mycobacterium sp. TaxID=1785 RepID=UPI0012737421|nr:CBS domain-containing protein [Mycobacterium sp.]KAA8968180.1 MAG: magnesium transporter [Mycobacterium sp.]